MDKDRLDLIINYDRGMRDVYRFATSYTAKRQNIAEHGGLVAILFIEICHEEEIDINEYEILYILRHDIMERITGDLPRPIKDEMGNEWLKAEKKLSLRNKYLPYYVDSNSIFEGLNKKKAIFEAAEALEALMFCEEELRVGNKSDEILSAINYYDNKLIDYRKVYSSIEDLYQAILNKRTGLI